MINFYLPDFWSFYKLNYQTIHLLKNNPEYFIDDLNIGAVYGSFPDVIWNSGRVYFGSCSQFNIRATIDGINSFGVPIRHTFTSSVLNENDVHDSLGNLICKVGLLEDVNHGVRNEILVNSSILEDYLRKNYPEYRYISSTTKCLDKKSFVEELESKRYELSVLDFHYNKDERLFYYLVDKDLQGGVEILLNPYCHPECTFERRKEHYKYLAQCQKNRVDPEKYCDSLKMTFMDCLENPTTIHKEELFNLIADGFKHFKIEGRTNHIVDVIESYVYYMIKPEYEMRVRNILLKGAFE